MEKHEVSPIEQLLDENNVDNITLYNEKDKPVEFEQIALIPLGKKVYAILRPVVNIQGLAEDEAIAFEINENLNTISVVLDEKVVAEIFDVYQKLMDEEEKPKK